MNWKLFILLLVVIGHGWQLLLNAVQYRSAGNPTPENVKDVYDAETYLRWKKYSAEKCRLQMVSTCVSLCVTLLLLALNVHARVAGLFAGHVYVQLFAVLVFQSLVDLLANVGIQYTETMVIEQKYGFNKSTIKTFAADQVRELVLGLVLNGVLVCLLALLHRTMGDWMLLLFAACVFLLTLVISFLAPYFLRIGNKFVPLEEGELRNQLMALLQRHGYQVKEIQVMDASRRTTKLNASFTGFGKTKTIILYDNLLNAMTTDEICAVFAHELGHGLHRDIPKMQLMNLGNILLMTVLVWLMVRTPVLYTAFGFAQVNYGFAYILLNIALSILQPLTGLLTNAFSRRAEYRADHQAVEEGYGPYLASGLKVLARENFAHLAPSALLVKLEYSHPPLSQRIAAVEKALQEQTCA